MLKQDKSLRTDLDMGIKLSGLIPIHKPSGVVSKDISRQLIKILKSYHDDVGRITIGHAGTLDPLASGVLPVLLGEATKLQDYLLNIPKTYEFDVKFGIETDTLDLEGKVVCEDKNSSVSENILVDTVKHFIGEVEQIPPIYSAVKVNGRPLYKYVRSGEEDAVDIAKHRRKVFIYSLKYISLDNLIGRFEVKCSKGTYVRSLARDIAKKIGTCGCVVRLVRKSAAGINLDQCIDLNTIDLSGLSTHIIPIDHINLGFPCWRAKPEFQTKLFAGQRLGIDDDEFKKCLISYENAVNTTNLEYHDVQLKSLDGCFFGIGSVKKDGFGKVIVHMKRGLL